MLDGEADIAPLSIPRAEVISVAKRALRRGERLGLAGQDTVYGLIERADSARQEGLLPMGLAPNAEVLVDLAPDQAIRWEDVAVEETPLLAMRQAQERMWEPTGGRHA